MTHPYTDEPPMIAIIGLMSGTSVDAVDAALIITNGIRFSRLGQNLNLPWPEAMRKEIFAIMDNPEKLNQPDIKATAERHIASHHAKAVMALMEQYDRPVDLIGFHGQTVLHRPDQGLSVQLGSATHLAELTGLPVAAQFRQNDLAHGGEGAPIAPIFHAALMENADITPPVAVANIGGITNLTGIGKHDLIGMDTGPGNAMMDRQMQQRAGISHDHDGQLAASGQINLRYLEQVLTHEWYQRQAPKSLDRVLTERMLASDHLAKMPLADAMASLAEVTAITLAQACKTLKERPERLLLSGGGARNPYLVNRIRHHSPCPVFLCDDLPAGSLINGDFIEAELMGFLAARCLYDMPITFPGTTGVDRPQSGGVICHPPTS